MFEVRPKRKLTERNGMTTFSRAVLLIVRQNTVESEISTGRFRTTKLDKKNRQSAADREKNHKIFDINQKLQPEL